MKDDKQRNNNAQKQVKMSRTSRTSMRAAAHLNASQTPTPTLPTLPIDRKQHSNVTAPDAHADAHALAIVSTAPRFRVVYTKKDGKTLRSATGTTHTDSLRQKEDGFPSSSSSSSSGYVCYFDLGVMAYRSFYLNNVKSIEALPPLS